jgi:folate-binding protein YgfZ
LLAGPRASSLIAAIDLSSEELEPLELVQIKWFGSRIDLIRAHSPLVPRFEIWSDSETLAKVRNQLIVAGAVPVHSEALEQLRILEGTPLYGTDIRDKDLPQETAQTRALHFSKGCYLGQEIVERIHSRGNVHRTFTGFELTGALPPTGTALTSEGKAVGELTSVASIPLSTGLIQLALGYIRREALLNTAQARNLPLQYPGGTAVPVSLPYTNL